MWAAAHTTLATPVSRQLQQFQFSRTPGRQKGRVLEESAKSGHGRVIPGSSRDKTSIDVHWRMLNGQPDLARLLEEKTLTACKSLCVFALSSCCSRLKFPFSVDSWRGCVSFQKPGRSLWRSMSSCTLRPLTPLISLPLENSICCSLAALFSSLLISLCERQCS